MSDDTAIIMAMTQFEHDDYVAGGCDPHCHACDKKINVGDRWALKIVVPMTAAPSGLVVRVRAMYCEQCTQADCDLPATERANLQGRLRTALNTQSRPVVNLASPHRGCFVLDNGTKF